MYLPTYYDISTVRYIDKCLNQSDICSDVTDCDTFGPATDVLSDVFFIRTKPGLFLFFHPFLNNMTNIG